MVFSNSHDKQILNNIIHCLKCEIIMKMAELNYLAFLPLKYIINLNQFI